MLILIDFDDVIYETLAEAIEICNDINNTNYKITDIKNYLEVPYQLQDCFKLVKYENKDKNNAIYYVKKLCENHDVYILTASIVDNLQEKRNWIETHLPEIGWNKTIVAKNKKLVSGEIIIDDAWHNIKGHNAKYKFLYNMPHNEDINESIGVVRINNLEKVIEVIGDGE